MEHFDAKAYRDRVTARMPRSQTLKFCLRAFWTGGLICCIGQAIGDVLRAFFVMTTEEVSAWTSIILIFLAALLTGIGVYDRIGSYAGAGSVVPITGFSNSVTAPAIEFKTEGFILGVGAKMFTIAGPVIVYGTLASVIYGVVYWLSLAF